MHLIVPFKRYLLVLITGICLLFPCVTAQAEKPMSDVRVVIDISGSMKKNDPSNLRKPAVDLIVRLLPDKSKASIWTFGQSVNMLVPHRVVDDAWRKEAIAKADSINSIALRTNIGSAVEKASAVPTTPGFQTHIILLTDGVVDIDPEAVVNMRERSRILKELLPGVKNTQVKIHTIALSDAADQELMKKLSVATDGVNQVAKNADELMSTFLRIFDQAVPAERVPLDEEGFLVDATVQEFTALIFRKSVDDKTQIQDPSGKTYDSTDPKSNVNWYRAKNYDLITVQSPVAGQWKVTTPMAPDSRVTVVSNLSLQVTPSANNIKRNQSLKLTYQFNEADKVITKPEFLNLLTADVILAHQGDVDSRQETINNQVIPADGIFQYEMTGLEQTGDYDLKLVIDGKTFRREYTHHFSVVDQNFRLEKSLKEDGEKKTYSYKITADTELVDTSKTLVKAVITNSQNNNMEKSLSILGNDHWELVFTPVQTAKYKVTFTMEGEGLDGAAISEALVAEEFYYPDEASVKADEAARAEAEKAKEQPEPEIKEEPAPQPKTEEPVTEETPSWVIYAAIGGANLLLIILGYLAYRVLLGKKGENHIDDIEKTLALDVKNIKPQASKSDEPSAIIDVSEENEVHIPIKDTPKSDDQSMADNLFPLESLEEPDDKKD